MRVVLKLNDGRYAEVGLAVVIKDDVAATGRSPGLRARECDMENVLGGALAGTLPKVINGTVLGVEPSAE